jgi:hypothetical protein
VPETIWHRLGLKKFFNEVAKNSEELKDESLVDDTFAASFCNLQKFVWQVTKSRRHSVKMQREIGTPVVPESIQNQRRSK